jgi:hypothetical protein
MIKFKLLKYFIKTLTNLINFANKLIKKTENFLTEDKLTLVRISRKKRGICSIKLI